MKKQRNVYVKKADGSLLRLYLYFEQHKITFKTNIYNLLHSVNIQHVQLGNHNTLLTLEQCTTLEQ